VTELGVQRLDRAFGSDATILSSARGTGRLRAALLPILRSTEVHAALSRPLQGGAQIAKTFIGFARLPTSRAWRLEPACINGMAGALIFDDTTGQLVQTIALAPSVPQPGRIGALYIRRNPDKLQGVLDALGRQASAGAR
jgi:hypothetical protein